MHKKNMAVTLGVQNIVTAGLNELEASGRKSARLVPLRDIVSRDPAVLKLLKDIKRGRSLQSIQLNDLFDLLRKILISPEAKTLLNSQKILAAANSRKYYFNARILKPYREALSASGIRQSADIPVFLLRAGLQPEQAVYNDIKNLLENIFSAENNALPSWLSAQEVFLLLTLLLKNSAKYTLPFDLAENAALPYFCFLSTVQDILLGGFTNLADISLEALHSADAEQTAVFRITFQDQDLRVYEKLLTLLLSLGQFQLPWDKLHIYCQNGEREALFNGMSIYAAFSCARPERKITYTEAIKFIEEQYVYRQKLSAAMDAEKNNLTRRDFWKITPFMDKFITHLDPVSGLTVAYFPKTGFFMRFSGQEIVLPIDLQGRAGELFGLLGEHQYVLERNTRGAYEQALAGYGITAPDFSISQDFQRLSPAVQKYFQQINRTPPAELDFLPLEDHAMRLIERINDVTTKGEFIEKVIGLLYANYDSLSAKEKDIYENRLILTAYNVSAADRVKIACRDALKHLTETGKISPSNYKLWLAQDLSYRGLELYTGELLKKLKDFQRHRRSDNIPEILTEILLQFLPLLREQHNNGLPVHLLHKIWKLERQFLKHNIGHPAEHLLTELAAALTALQDWFHEAAVRAEKLVYKPVWNKAPSENPLLVKLRPFFSLLANIFNRNIENRALFAQFRQELDAFRSQRIMHENLIPAARTLKVFLGTDDIALLLPLIKGEMRSEINKFIRAGHSFEQNWYFRGNGSASAYTIASILTYARERGCTLSVLAEDLCKAISAEVGNIPGLSKDSIEDKLLRCEKPSSSVSVNAGVEKLLIALLKLRTNDPYCAYHIGLTCVSAEVVGQSVYNMIARAGSESALTLIQVVAPLFHNHKDLKHIAIALSLLLKNELCAVSLLEFNEKGKNYELIATLDILLWTLGAMSCIPQIADGTNQAEIAAYLYAEQGQRWEELKKARNNLRQLLSKPDFAYPEYQAVAGALREQLVSIYLGFTFPKGANNLLRKLMRGLVRGSADGLDYLMSLQLLSEATQKIKDELPNYRTEDTDIALPLAQTPAVTLAYQNAVPAPSFVEGIGRIQKIGKGRQADYIVYSEYMDTETGRRYLVRKLLSENTHTLQTDGLRLRETNRALRHLERAREILAAEP